jgi:T-complex protein 1 subunit delta
MCIQMDNTVVINDYRQMDKVIKEGRQYLLNICKKIKKANCNVLLIQKSILRDAVDDTSLNFLKRLNILVVKDVERDEIQFLSKSLGCKPIADIDAFTEDKLGYADLVEETSHAGVKVVRITGVKNHGRTVSILAMGGNHLVVEECERSLHDALCVVRCLVKKRYAVQLRCVPPAHLSTVPSLQGVVHRRFTSRVRCLYTPNLLKEWRHIVSRPTPMDWKSYPQPLRKTLA